MKIGLISTLDNNIGDDFIREGIIKVLHRVFKGRDLEFVIVNKHRPYMVYPDWHPRRLREYVKHLPAGKKLAYDLLWAVIPRIKVSRFDDCDLIVQCGTPVFWQDCHKNEDTVPIWYDVVSRLYKRIPVINLAAGACYSFASPPSRIDDPDDKKYLKDILGFCRITSVRDSLAKQLCAELGFDVPLIPCSALLPFYGERSDLGNKDLILVNYLHGGGLFDFGQNVDPALWCHIVKKLIQKLERRHSLAFLCHSEKEYFLSQKIYPSLPRYWPKDFRDYLSLAAKTKLAISNRMHPCVILAGFGIPSIGIGKDTRLLTLKELGLPYYYVKDASSEILYEQVELLLANASHERERLLSLREHVFDQYCGLLQQL